MKYYTYPDYMAAEPKFRYNDNETLVDIVGDNFTQQVCPADPRYSTCFSKDGSYYIEIFWHRK